ncbi:hypothetical protein ACFSTD_15605 [Novosphingobium colocasiae]
MTDPSPASTLSASRHPWLVLFALATGAFAIGTTEFAAMSLVPFFSAATCTSPSRRRGTRSALMRWAW